MGRIWRISYLNYHFCLEKTSQEYARGEYDRRGQRRWRFCCSLVHNCLQKALWRDIAFDQLCFESPLSTCKRSTHAAPVSRRTTKKLESSEERIQESADRTAQDRWRWPWLTNPCPRKNTKHEGWFDAVSFSSSSLQKDCNLDWLKDPTWCHFRQ